ncbi:MAG: ABC transporter permease [Clostridiales bacterium]|jgi:multidrug/hemolysin transport system permease protein|nr:ABC transporter permease [Clostridiales bacterium]
MLWQIKRNILGYFRNKASFWCSLISMFVIVGLYSLFLMDVMVLSIEQMSQAAADGARAYAAAWLVSSLIVVNAMNSTLAAATVMVEDEEFKKTRDFVISPAPAYKRMLAYIAAAVISGLIISFATLILGYLIVLIIGKTALGALVVLQLIPGIIITVLAVAAVTVCGFTFVKKVAAVSVISMLVGILAGFLIGAYMPIGQMAKPVQVVMKCVPFTYAAAFFRSVMLPGISAELFGGAPPGTEDAVGEFMGNFVMWGNYRVPPWLCLVILTAAAVIFFGLTVLRFKLQKRRS